jgi:hypothetical protein
MLKGTAKCPHGSLIFLRNIAKIAQSKVLDIVVGQDTCLLIGLFQETSGNL